VEKTKNVLIFIITIAVALALNFTAYGAKPAAKSEKLLTRGDMAIMLTTTNFMKEKIGALFNFSIGYNLSLFNRSTMAPMIRYAKVNPYMIPPDGRTLFLISAAVDDPGGLSQIVGVRADTSSLGKLSNMTLVDNGSWGDQAASDGVYTLQTNVKANIEEGEKEIPISVVNKKGWMSIAKTNVIIEKKPTIIDAHASPKKITADGKTKTLLTVKIYNPEGVEGIKSVFVDLTQIGGEKNTQMYDDGTHGDLNATDKIFSLTVVPKSSVPAGEKRLQFSVPIVNVGIINGEIVLRILK
jgi:hypothetical protein